MKRIILAALVFVAMIVGIAAYFLEPRCFYQSQIGGIYFDGVELSESIAYRKGNGDMIILLVKDTDEYGLFFVSEQERSVGYLSRSDLFRMPKVFITRYLPVHQSIIERNNPKTDFDPELVITPVEVSFWSASNRGRIELRRLNSQLH